MKYFIGDIIMKVLVLHINECKPGMKTAQTIFNKFGAVLASNNSILTNKSINKLSHFKIKTLKVYEESEEVRLLNLHAQLEIQHKENVKALKQMMKNVSFGENFDTQTVSNIAQNLVLSYDTNEIVKKHIHSIKNINDYIYNHSINSALIAYVIGKKLSYSESQIQTLIQSALLHDIGMSKVSKIIVNKTSSLTKDEYDAVKMHAKHGYDILKLHNSPEEAMFSALLHHERNDGQGYLLGIEGSQIHDFARIISIADVFSAMISDRVYRKKTTPFEVFKVLENEKHNSFDPLLVDVFLSTIPYNYVGEKVKLSTGEVAEIVHINPKNVSCPIVKSDTSYIDLNKSKNIKIVELKV